MNDGAVSGPSDHEDELAAVRAEFAEGLPARVALLRGALARLKEDTARDARHAFYLPAHALKGTAASFGAAEVAAVAADLAALGHRWLERGPPREENLEATAGLLDRLAAAVERYRHRVTAP